MRGTSENRRANDDVALVTGASSGIGAAIARRLAAEGRRVALVARGAEGLESLAADLDASEDRLLALPADVADAGARERVVRQVHERWGHIDILVNNAGFGRYSRVKETGRGSVDSMFQVNVNAPIHLTQLVLDGMLARRHGHVINMASLAGHIAAPPLTVYAATKHAVIGFSRGLHRELRGTGVRVTVVSPGPVRTSFGRVASGRPVDPAKAPGGIAAERVARRVSHALRRPRRELVIPAWYWPGVVLEHLFPWLVDYAAARQERAWMRAVERAEGEGHAR
jgi:uncharacterized protein